MTKDDPATGKHDDEEKKIRLRLKTHIPELNFSQLTQSADDFTSDLGGDVELGQGHVRGAEHGVLVGRHDGGSGDKTSGEVCLSRNSMGAGYARWWLMERELPRTPAR